MRGNYGGGSVPTTVWPPQVAPATLSERRSMKKIAQPEHSYTGYVPKWIDERDAPEMNNEAPPRKRNAPILGYSGHLRHEEDRVGTTFTRGLEVARQPVAAPAGPLSASYPLQYTGNQLTADETTKRVTFHDEGLASPPFKAVETRATGHTASMSKRSGYASFEGGASTYGQFQSKPMSARSGYGAFENASGYGEFQAKPMSARSGYGAFDNASGYGEFAAPPANGRAAHSTGSGYGDFDAASGYGEFLSAPLADMSPRSGYGEFDTASGYGTFHARPEQDSSPRSDDSREYGAFGIGGNASVQHGDLMSARSGYGAFDNASGYGDFATPPPPNHQQQPPAKRVITVKLSDELDRQYQRALRAVGGELHVQRLLDAFATTIAQRHHKRHELLQALKRNFEKHELQNQGSMTKAHLKEALLGLSCVFTDDQIMALMATYDPECRGVVPMDALLLDLSKRVVSKS